MLRNCTEAAYHVNKARMVRLAEYSRDSLLALRAETGLRYDDRQSGTLQLFRTQKQLDHVADDTAVLDEGGVPYQVLDRAGCIGVEPALAHAKGSFLGGLRLPGDETGDAHQFTQRLAAMAADHGWRSSTAPRSSGSRPREAHHRRRRERAHACGGRHRAGAGQLLAEAVGTARHRHPGLPREGGTRSPCRSTTRPPRRCRP